MSLTSSAWSAGVVDAVSALKTVEDIVADVDSILTGESSTRNQPQQSGATGHSAAREDWTRRPGEYKLRMWSRDQYGSWNTSLGNLEHVGGDNRRAMSQDNFSGGHRYVNSASALPTGRNRNRIRQSKSTHVHMGRTTSAISKRTNDTGTIQVLTV
jgi:hypothetical protein